MNYHPTDWELIDRILNNKEMNGEVKEEMNGCCATQCNKENEIHKPDFEGQVWHWMRRHDESMSDLLERIWDTCALAYKDKLDEAVRLRDYWWRQCNDRTEQLNQKHDELNIARNTGVDLIRQNGELEQENERLKKEQVYWYKEWSKAKEDFYELQRSLTYKQELNEELAHKLNEAAKREAELRKRVDQIEYIQESIDALERMIHLLKQQTVKPCCS